jgi:hypothetical protein
MKDQNVLNIVSIVAIIVGPIFAVLITIWYQNRKQRQDNKHKLFLTIMAYRKTDPPHPYYIDALNTLEVVFDRHPSVLKLWHEFFESLCQPNPTAVTFELRRKKLLDLLYEMARVLKYKNLKQTEIDIFYKPQGQIDQSQIQSNIQTEWLRILKNSESFAGQKNPTGAELPPASGPSGHQAP